MSERSNNDFLNIDSKFKKSSTFKGCDLENYDDDFFYLSYFAAVRVGRGR